MPTYANSINGNEILAKRSQCDYAGNDLQTTYATKSEVTTGLASKQDTISDLATIRSGAADGATAVQPGDLAAVATTGAYSDLTGTPTIPTATSDLTNDSGFITLSDVPAQVNADWNSSSGASEILNKPTIPSGAQLVPTATSADADKVLTVDSQGTPAWSTPAAGGVTDVEVNGTSVVSGGVASITTPTVDQVYNSASTNAQSGTAVAGALAGVNQVPASTSSDEGKVLTVDANGDPEWAAGGSSQVQSDWTEDDTTEPSYIQNKPTPKTLTAGTGISITENASTITISSSVTAPVRDVTVNGSSVVSNGVAAITSPTVDQTYDASSTNAQSGVAVASGISDAVAALPTNLTSAQIQALKEALGVDETVLYSGVKTNSNDGSATYTLSELPTNFQYIEVQYSANDNSFAAAINGNCGVGSVRWDTTIYQSYNTTVWLLMNGSGDLTTLTNYTISANFHNIRTTTWSVQGFLNAATTNAKWFHINKIIGIHRIANN